jgi:hypothetical protein
LPPGNTAVNHRINLSGQKYFLLSTRNSALKNPATPCADVPLNPQKQVGAASFLQDEIIIRQSEITGEGIDRIVRLKKLGSLTK